MTTSNDPVHDNPRKTRPATRFAGPPRYGYPKYQPSRMEALEAEVADLRREVERLKSCHTCINGSHDLRVGDEVPS